MKKLIYSALCLAIVASMGCAITDYPVVTDDRGGFSGVIRTGHRAYITPTSQVATIYADGSDELFTLVYQNQYGDQKLYTKNNFDFSASVLFLDQTYCDWRSEFCEITRAWNPAQDNIDNVFDYEFFPDCSGARSLSLLLAQGSRIGECGDANFHHDLQNLASEFSGLSTTNWRGGSAFVVPIDASNTTITLTSEAGIVSTAPIYGQFTGFITDELQTVLMATPNVRHGLRWFNNWAIENGSDAMANISYGDVSAEVAIHMVPAGFQYNLGRF